MTSTETENNPNHENYLNAACQILKKCCELAPKNTSIAIFENNAPNYSLLDSCSNNEKFHLIMKNGIDGKGKDKNCLIKILNKINSNSSGGSGSESITYDGNVYQIITADEFRLHLVCPEKDKYLFLEYSSRYQVLVDSKGGSESMELSALVAYNLGRYLDQVVSHHGNS